MTLPLKALFDSFVKFAKAEPNHDFPLTVAWAALSTKVAGFSVKSKQVVTFYIQNHSPLYKDALAIYSMLSLFRLVSLIHQYKAPTTSFDERHGDSIPVSTPLSRIYRYDFSTDQCVNIRDDTSYALKTIKNMPTKYSNKESMRALVNSAEIPLVTQELLLHAVQKPGGHYLHTIAHITLGKQAEYGRPRRDTVLKQLAVEIKDDGNDAPTYLHYYSIQLAEYRKRWFLSRYDNARETLIDYKLTHYSTTLSEAVRFLDSPIVVGSVQPILKDVV
jgi:hypothetical protein